MVSFACAQCGDVVTKPKVKTHMQRCWTAGFSCVDCNKNFDTTEVNAHTDCVTETQRYAGKWLAKQAEQRKQKADKPAEAKPKRKRSPVKELSSPEWTPENAPAPAPKKPRLDEAVAKAVEAEKPKKEKKAKKDKAEKKEKKEKKGKKEKK